RDRLRLAGPRPAHRAGDHGARFHGCAGRGAARRGHRDRAQPDRRPALQRHRPAHPHGGECMSAVSARSPARPKLPRAVVPFAAILGLLVLMALLAPLIAPADPNTQNLLARLKAPGFESRGVVYYLGSDELGRDVLSRVIYGARVSLLV